MTRVLRDRPPRSWSAAATACALTAAAGVLLPSTPAAAESAPYVDSRSTGSLTLCDAHGQSLTGGSLSARPLVHFAVAQTAAVDGYAKGRGTATLYAYQPRQGLAPGEWSGELLTGASRFGDVRHPAAAALPEDLSLADFARDFPPAWDGLVQLRLVLGAPGQSAQDQRYDSADVRISGSRWTVLKGGGGSCSGVKAISVAQLLGVQATAVPTPAVAPSATATPATTRPAGSTAASSATRPAPSAGATAISPTASSRSLSYVAVSLAGLVGLLFVGSGGVYLRHRSARA